MEANHLYPHCSENSLQPQKQSDSEQKISKRDRCYLDEGYKNSLSSLICSILEIFTLIGLGTLAYLLPIQEDTQTVGSVYIICLCALLTIACILDVLIIVFGIISGAKLLSIINDEIRSRYTAVAIICIILAIILQELVFITNIIIMAKVRHHNADAL